MLTSSSSGTARLGGWFFGLGATGLIATCLFYVLAGPAAALPYAYADSAQAIAATPGAAIWMRLAGTVGMFSDVLLGVGAVLLALHEKDQGDAGAAAGWIALGMAGTVFIFVDATVAWVLPLGALRDGPASTYMALRALFDIWFTIGTWAAGAGALVLAWSRNGTVFVRPAVGWLMRLAGAMCLLSSTLQLLGLPGAAFMGPGIGVLAVAGIGAALAYGLFRTGAGH